MYIQLLFIQLFFFVIFFFFLLIRIKFTIMKKYITTIILLFFVSIYSNSQSFRPLDKSPMDLIEFSSSDGEKAVRVLYSRPQLKGRNFSSLVPNGKLWRTGANESTEITFYKPASMNNVKIEKGSYTLYTIPNENEWTIIINKATHTWGAYRYNKKDDVLRFNVPTKKSDNLIEALSMVFESSSGGGNLVLGWSDKIVKIPFKI